MENLPDVLQEEIDKFGGRPSTQTLNDKTFDPIGYETAIRRATRDLTARTLGPKKKANTDTEQGADNTLTNFLLSEDSFGGQIKKFFDNDPLDKDSFDNWHKKRCAEVLAAIQDYYTNRDGSSVCYGKAQKIVNMTLKGCYCLNGAREREAHFQYCHIALDSFTLAWYNRNASQKTKTVWSNLSEAEYMQIQSKIRKIVPETKLFTGLTPLQMEFLIWPLEIMIETVKAVNKCFGGLIDEDYAVDYFKEYGLENELTMTNIILGKITPDELPEEFACWLEHIPKNQTNKRAAADFIRAKYGLK